LAATLLRRWMLRRYWLSIGCRVLPRSDWLLLLLLLAAPTIPLLVVLVLELLMLLLLLLLMLLLLLTDLSSAVVVEGLGAGTKFSASQYLHDCIHTQNIH
jgi:hypothetical protein